MSETRSPRVPGQGSSPGPTEPPAPVEGRAEREHLHPPCTRCGGYDGQMRQDPFTGEQVHAHACTQGQNQGQIPRGMRQFPMQPGSGEIRRDGRL